MAQHVLEGTRTTEHTALSLTPRHKSITTPHAQINRFSSRRCPGPPVKVHWRIKTLGEL